jgi:MFS family permease
VKDERTKAFRLVVANGALFMFGMAFMDPDIVLPGFVHRLTGSAIMVGMVSSIVKAGWFWPQMIVSSFIEHRPRKMPVYALSAVIRVTSMLLLALMLFLAGDTQPRLFFPAFLLLLACNVSFSGVAGIPFMDIVAKTVDAERYGILFGSRRFLGGILACGAGFVVRSVLSERSGFHFPHDYALLFLFSGVLTALACASFVLVKEPVESEPGKRSPFVKHMMRAPAILRHDLDYRRLFLIRMLTSFSGMAAPFYVPFAIHKLGVGYETTGTFLAAGMGGVIVGTVLWSYISYRHGSPTLFLIAGIGGLVPPIIALVTSLLASSTSVSYAHLVVPYYFVFASATAAATGFAIAGSAYLLEIAPKEIRPTYVGFMNTLTFPFMFASVLAGLLIKLVSYEFAFGLCLVVGVLLVLEARKITPAAGKQP